MNENVTSDFTAHPDRADARLHTLLALGWPTSVEVGQRACPDAPSPGLWAKNQRDAGMILGGWDAEAGTFRYPPFQFEANGQPVPLMKDLLSALAEHPDWTITADANGWRRLYWLFQPFRSLSRASLRYSLAELKIEMSPKESFAFIKEWVAPISPRDALARTPAEVFIEDPRAVIAMAHRSAIRAHTSPDRTG